MSSRRGDRRPRKSTTSSAKTGPAGQPGFRLTRGSRSEKSGRASRSSSKRAGKTSRSTSGSNRERIPRRIRMAIGGARSLRIDEAGALVVGTGLGDVSFTPPVAYQEIGGARRPVEVAYELRGTEYGFSLADYDPALPVLIDPLRAVDVPGRRPGRHRRRRRRSSGLGRRVRRRPDHLHEFSGHGGRRAAGGRRRRGPRHRGAPEPGFDRAHPGHVPGRGERRSRQRPRDPPDVGRRLRGGADERARFSGNRGRRAAVARGGRRRRRRRRFRGASEPDVDVAHRGDVSRRHPGRRRDRARGPPGVGRDLRRRLDSRDELSRHVRRRATGVRRGRSERRFPRAPEPGVDGSRSGHLPGRQQLRPRPGSRDPAGLGRRLRGRVDDVAEFSGHGGRRPTHPRPRHRARRVRRALEFRR